MTDINNITAPVEIFLDIEHETEDAFLVTTGERDEEPQWIPKSQVYWEAKAAPGLCVEFTMPEWLAMEKDYL